MLWRLMDLHNCLEINVNCVSKVEVYLIYKWINEVFSRYSFYALKSVNSKDAL